MTIKNRILTLGLGLGMLATSATAFAQTPYGNDNRFVPYQGQHQYQRGGGTFAAWDTDRNGVLSVPELQMGEWPSARAEFDRGDRNNDGVLTFGEATRAGIDTSDWRFSDRAQVRDGVVRVSDRFHYGARIYRQPRPVSGLTLIEMQRLSSTRSRAKFVAADANNDGFLTRREFRYSRGRA